MENKKANYKLGLDISTSIIGVCLFKEDKFFKFYHLDLTKVKCVFEKSKLYEKLISEIFEEYNFTSVYIEDTLQSFSRGLSSAKTLMTLAKFNGIVSYITHNISGLIPDYINVNTARKTLGIKIDKNSNIDKKEQVLRWVDSDLEKKFDWPKKTISRGKNIGVVKFEKFCYDISDAYVICKAGIIINEQSTKSD